MYVIALESLVGAVWTGHRKIWTIRVSGKGKIYELLVEIWRWLSLVLSLGSKPIRSAEMTCIEQFKAGKCARTICIVSSAESSILQD